MSEAEAEYRQQLETAAGSENPAVELCAHVSMFHLARMRRNGHGAEASAWQQMINTASPGEQWWPISALGMLLTAEYVGLTLPGSHAESKKRVLAFVEPCMRDRVATAVRQAMTSVEERGGSGHFLVS